MSQSDKFGINFDYEGNGYLVCLVCFGRDSLVPSVFDWPAWKQDMNLTDLVSRAQAHWARFHVEKEDESQ